MADTGKTLQAFFQLLHATGSPPELSFSIEGPLCILFDIMKDQCMYISPQVERFSGHPENWYRGRRSRHFLQKVIHPVDFHTFYMDAILSTPRKYIPCNHMPDGHCYDIQYFCIRIAHNEGYWIPIEGDIIRVFRNENEKPRYLLASTYIKQDNNASDEHLIESLTPREKEILQMISNGDSSKIIADNLKISLETVVTHRKHLIRKLRVKNSMELVKIALLHKLIN